MVRVVPVIVCCSVNKQSGTNICDVEILREGNNLWSVYSA